VFLAVAVAAGSAACPTNLDYLQNGGTEAGSDISIPNDDSGDTGAGMDATNPGADGGGPDVRNPGYDGGGSDVTPPVVDSGLIDPALLPDAATVTCPTMINGVLTSTDGVQIGRYSRVPSASVCGMMKSYPTTMADPSNPHRYDAYRFLNATSASVCFNFTLTYGGVPPAGDAAVQDAASMQMDAGPPPNQNQLYMAAYTTFYPTNLAVGYLGDVGAVLTPPQTMGITVPAGGTIDVTVYAIGSTSIDNGPDPYTLTCATQ
jgi:hypothetical protein